MYIKERKVITVVAIHKANESGCRLGDWHHGHRSHAHTVVWECCKDDHQSQWERAKFDPQPTENPLTDRYQIWITWLRRAHLPPNNIWGQSVQGVLPIYVKYTPSNVRMFSFFSYNYNNNNRICIAQVCRMTSEALDGQLQSCYTARARPKCLTEEKCF